MTPLTRTNFNGQMVSSTRCRAYSRGCYNFSYLKYITVKRVYPSNHCYPHLAELKLPCMKAWRLCLVSLELFIGFCHFSLFYSIPQKTRSQIDVHLESCELFMGYSSPFVQTGRRIINEVNISFCCSQKSYNGVS